MPCSSRSKESHTVKNTLRAFALCAALISVVPTVVGAPFVSSATLSVQLGNWLVGTPMTGFGQTLFQQVFFYNIDSRLVVAMAGMQTSYSALAGPGYANPLTSNDPLYLLGCNPGELSFPTQAAVQAVTQNLKFNYQFSAGSSIDLISLVANQYCVVALVCALPRVAWAQVVRAIYTNPAHGEGGDLTDLSYPGATIDLDQLSGPCCFTTYP
jgi:hypothetical protein